MQNPETFTIRLVGGGVPGAELRLATFAGNNYLVPFTVFVEYAQESTGELFMVIEGTIDESEGQPVLRKVVFDSDSGLDLPSLQKQWRWQWLLERGLHLWWTGPGHREELDAFLKNHGRRHALTDGYLAAIAARYIEIGRGYAPQLAREHFVSPRTITSWVVLARERGLLTPPERVGAVGGQLTPAGKRALQAERRRRAKRGDQP